MTKPVLISAVLASLLLAACGGGGSSGGGFTPNPGPSNTPTTYAAKLVFVGSMAGAIQSDLRQVQAIAPMTSGTPIPIMVVSAPESGADASYFGGQVEAEVSPMPSSTPAVSFSNTNPSAVLETPSPLPSASPQPLPTGVIAEAIVKGSNAVQSQITGTASATIGAPVNQTPTAAVYSYMSIALDEGTTPGGVLGTGYTRHSGWKWNGSTWIADDNSADADIYIDASDTIHVPGGDTRLSTDNAFSAISAGQWTSAETYFTLTQAITQNADGSNNGIVIGKTRNGSAVFKLFPNTIDRGAGYFGAIEVSGSSVDGF